MSNVTSIENPSKIAITRPNGKPYRPRMIKAALLGNHDEVVGVVVFGLHDALTARDTAQVAVDEYLSEMGGYWSPGYTLGLGEDHRLVWWRSVPNGTGEDDELLISYVDDKVRGRAGVRFDVMEMIENRPADDPSVFTDPTQLPPAMFDVDGVSS